MVTRGSEKKALVVTKSSLKSERRAVRNPDVLDELKISARYLERVLVRLRERFVFVQTDEIDWVEAEGNYVRLHCGQQSYVLRRGIGQLEARLNPSAFLRIHRSTIVNIGRIRELQPRSHGELTVVLHDFTELIWSRGYKDRLKRF